MGDFSPSFPELIATAVFVIAVVHTFMAKKFANLAHQYPEGSIGENLLHFLSETEIVFGLWAAVLFLGVAVAKGSLDDAVHFIEGLNYTEPKFVFVVMVVAATRPIVLLAERMLNVLSRAIPIPNVASFYLVALSVGPLLGSLITEPAAMTLLAILLKQRYFDHEISRSFAYATVGLLFVNVSIGGTLTHFAAPPVLMVAHTWGWDSSFMVMHFGWRAAVSCLASTACVFLIFRKELLALPPVDPARRNIPHLLTVLHVAFLAAVVYFAHHPDIFFGVFMLFLGLTTATREYQDRLRLKEGLLVGFFLAGLVTLGSLQEYWLKPLLMQLNGSMMFFGATFLTAITDNAALTYLGSLVEGIGPELQYALVAGAVTGGGLTVIANAPNPAGVGILQTSAAFGKDGISPFGLLLGALGPTMVAIIFFWFV